MPIRLLYSRPFKQLSQPSFVPSLASFTTAHNLQIGNHLSTALPHCYISLSRLSAVTQQLPVNSDDRDRERESARCCCFTVLGGNGRRKISDLRYFFRDFKVVAVTTDTGRLFQILAAMTAKRGRQWPKAEFGKQFHGRRGHQVTPIG